MGRAFVRISTAAVLMVGAAACDPVGPESWGDRRAEMEEQRAVWADAGVDSYRYRVMRGCYCSGPVGEFEVTVVAGEVSAAEATQDGEAVPDSVLAEIPTVDDLFAVIEEAITAEVDDLDVEYHPELGYPTLIDIDRDQRAIDDEVTYQAEGLVATTGQS